MRLMRGFFRLWLVVSLLWIGGVAAMTWLTLPSFCPRHPSVGDVVDATCFTALTAQPFDPDVFLAKFDAQAAVRQQAIERSILIALMPPLGLLVVGSALIWALRGFRPS